MTMTIDCPEARLLLPAREALDLPHALALDAHLETCSDCRERMLAEQAVGRALRERIPYFRAPTTLRDRLREQMRASPLQTAAKPMRQRSSGVRRHQPRAWVAALAASLMLGFGLGRALDDRSADTVLADEIVAGHVRSLLAAHLDDVASSDRHTVKPWFATRLDYAPPVQDLAAAGYPLAGGRLDYIGQRRVAALDYRHRQHIINLYVWPAGSEHETAPQAETRSGYRLVRWTADGMCWWAVSDLNEAELREFAEQMRRAQLVSG